MFKTFGQITWRAVGAANRARKARHQAAVGGFQTEAKATGAQVDQGGETLGNTTHVMTCREVSEKPLATVVLSAIRRDKKGAASTSGGTDATLAASTHSDAGRRVYVLK